jgi:histone acetyltransferase (RNA polymerase elongator complex component)
MQKKLRLATINDIDDISQLIQLSARKLGGEFYDEKTIELALQGAFGVDTQLIKDQTYYVIVIKNTIIACGGWSYRKTLFGSDDNNIRNPEKLNPIYEAAKIRAFFIHPDFARQGLGNLLLNECENQAKLYGFSQCHLMSTLSGVDFYQNNGYQGNQYINHYMDDKNQIQFLPMTKSI